MRKLIAAIHQLIKIGPHRHSVIDYRNFGKLVAVHGKFEDIAPNDCGRLTGTDPARLRNVNGHPRRLGGAHENRLEFHGAAA